MFKNLLYLCKAGVKCVYSRIWWQPSNQHKMKQFQNPLLDIKFDQVCMYDYHPTYDVYYDLIADGHGRLIPTETIKNTVLLDDSTTRQLTLLLGNSSSYGDDIMRCFIPHLAFVYFLDKKIVFHVSICLTCNNLRPSIDIPAHSTGRGMTKLFRDFLNDLLEKYEFSNNVRNPTDQTTKTERLLTL